MKFISGLILITTVCTSQIIQAADKLVILSPHRKTIQNEFVPVFKDYYKKKFGSDIAVDWLDQGGTNEGVKFIKTKFAANSNSSGVDIFWGGGTTPYVELQNMKFLVPFKPSKSLDAQLPKEIAGVRMRDKDNNWFASAVSSFGIFYNKKLLGLEKIPEPKTWTDLVDPKLFKKVILCDPRKSGTYNQMFQIMVQSLGWSKGFEVITAMSANSTEFTASSSDPIKAITSGAASITPAIDFYALPKVEEVGKNNLGFVLPEGKTVLDPDPVAILKGAPNQKTAERFVEWLLSPEAQAIFMLPKGAAGGPKLETLSRMGINTESYKITEGKRFVADNPLKMKSSFKLDADKAAKVRQVFDDLLGATIVDTHKDLKKAWEKTIKAGAKPEAIAALAKPPITEDEMVKLSEKWSDNVFRNQKINEWVTYAKNKYAH